MTAPFNNMWTLKFKAQPTNAFFAIVNQTFGGPSQLSTTAECAVIKLLSTVQTIKQSSAVVESWKEPPTMLLMVAKNAFAGWALNFKACMLLKGAVSQNFLKIVWLIKVKNRTVQSQPKSTDINLAVSNNTFRRLRRVLLEGTATVHVNLVSESLGFFC